MKVDNVNCKVPCRGEGGFQENVSFTCLLSASDVRSDGRDLAGMFTPEHQDLILPSIHICLTVECMWVQVFIVGPVKCAAWKFNLLDIWDSVIFRQDPQSVPHNSQLGLAIGGLVAGDNVA